MLGVITKAPATTTTEEPVISLQLVGLIGSFEACSFKVPAAAASVNFAWTVALKELFAPISIETGEPAIYTASKIL